MGDTEEEVTLKDLKNLILGIDKRLEKIENSSASIKATQIAHGNDIRDLQHSNELLKSENESLRAELAGAKRGLFNINKQNREMNVLLHNVDDIKEINEDLFNYVSKIVEEIGVQKPQIANVKRIGFNPGRRPVAITLLYHRDRKIFFDSSMHLKVHHKIRVTGDFPKEQREEYNRLRELKNRIVERGIHAEIIKGKIMIEGKKHKINEAEEILAGLENGGGMMGTSPEVYQGINNNKNMGNQALAETNKKRLASQSPEGSFKPNYKRKNFIPNNKNTKEKKEMSAITEFSKSKIST